MIVLGILGDIGSGKSFVSKQFKCPIFSADHEVNKIYRKNKICYKKLKNKLPKFIKTYPIKKKELISAINSNKKNLKEVSDFERLEFLGDRVLGLAISSIIYKKFDKNNEGDLSKKLSYLVQKNFLHK